VVGAHPDDAELGAGASIARHSQMGDEVSILVMSRGREREGGYSLDVIHKHALAAGQILGADVRMLGYEDQTLDAVRLIDLTMEIEREMAELEPRIVYTHSAGDLNRDHQIVAQAVATACRPLPGSLMRSLYAFEVQSSTEWGSGFRPTMFRDVRGWPMQKKLDALACYQSEMRPFPHPRSKEAIQALAVLRGATAGLELAEAFEVVREIR